MIEQERRKKNAKGMVEQVRVREGVTLGEYL